VYVQFFIETGAIPVSSTNITPVVLITEPARTYTTH
jgi:hypothetical protein